MPDFRYVEANGLTHRVAMKGDGPLVLFVHGFPESWYSWRHQIVALADAGFTAAAPDVRGYGGTDKPHAIDAYTMEQHTADMAGIAAALSPDAPAIIVGHDWGAPIAWNSALLHPVQFQAVAGLSVPYLSPGDEPAIDLYKKVFTDNGLFFYQVYFQEEGIAEAELEADPARSIRLFYYSISGDLPENAQPFSKKHGDVLLSGMPEPELPLPWLSEKDVSYYASEFARSGFRGPLNRYRNQREDHAFLKSQPDLRIHQPSFYIGGTRDPVLTFFQGDPLELMQPTLPNLQGYHVLEGCGHWTQQERASEVNELLISWARSL